MLGPFKLSIFLLGTQSAYLELLIYYRRITLVGATVSTAYFAPLRAGNLSLHIRALFNFNGASLSTLAIS
jgi:hypothetical protein